MNYISVFLAAVVVTIGGYFGISHYTPQAQLFEGFNPSGGQQYRLNSSIGTANTGFTLSSFKEPVSNIPYTMTYLGSSIVYGTLDPQTSRSEFISFTGITQNTDGTASISGVSRGLSRTPSITSGCTSSTTLKQTHAGQSIFILSDSPCFFTEYAVKQNDQTISGIWSFSSTSPPRYDFVGAQANGTYISTTSEFASIAYVNAISFAGVTNATESGKGIVQLATGLQAASSSVLGSTGAGLVLQAKNATDTPQNCTLASPCVPITDTAGKLAALFIKTTAAYSWSALHTFSAGLLSTASSTFTNTSLGIGGVAYTFPSSISTTTATTTLQTSGNGTLQWLQPDFSVIFSSTTVGAIATSSFKDIPGRSYYEVHLDIPARSTAACALQFNGDTGANYGFRTYSNDAAVDSGDSVNALTIDSSSAQGLWLNFDINNVAARQKVYSATGMTMPTGSTGGTSRGATAVWNNTSAQITRIDLGCGSAVPSGTRLTVYGSNY